jgi:hypothetical protein
MTSVIISVFLLEILGWVILSWLLIFGRAPLLVEQSGGLLLFVQDLFSLDSSFQNFVFDDSLLVEELLSFSELYLLDCLLNFGYTSLSFLKDFVMLDFALLETLIVLREDLLSLDRELRLLDLAILLSFFDLLSLLLGFLDV